nr:aldo/keto reductase [Micromonospora noduli]
MCRSTRWDGQLQHLERRRWPRGLPTDLRCLRHRRRHHDRHLQPVPGWTGRNPARPAARVSAGRFCDHHQVQRDQAAPARPGTTGNSRKIMVRSLEASLRRLNTDYVDVFMPHFPDGLTPVEEILAGFDELIRSGKILHGALSNFPAWRVAGAAVRANLRGLAPLVGIQTEYSLAERSAERELLPMAQAHGLGVVLYSPLAGGLLTGKYRQGEHGRLTARGDAIEGSAQRTAVVDAVLTMAEELGASAVQVSLAWLRRRAALAPTALIPIVGPRILTQLEEYLKSLQLELSDQYYRQLDEVSAIRPGTPHEDVTAALNHGFDGDRTLLDPPPVPVI